MEPGGGRLSFIPTPLKRAGSSGVKKLGHRHSAAAMEAKVAQPAAEASPLTPGEEKRRSSGRARLSCVSGMRTLTSLLLGLDRQEAQGEV